MNLRVRITFGFLIIVFVMACVSGIIIWQESNMYRAFQHSSQISEIEKYFLECRRQEKNFIIRHDSESVQLFSSNYDTLNMLVLKMLDHGKNGQMIENLTTLQENLDNYYIKFEEIIRSSQIEMDNAKMQSEVDLARESHALINEIKAITKQEFNNAYAVTNNVNIFSILIGLFLSVLIAGFISTKIMEILGSPDDYLTTNR
ncbi:hypothetical protein KKF86_07950 [bacterium]|nr:hypothetical protein [bacterium]